MELIIAAYCWQIMNKLPRMNRTDRGETQCRQAVHKLITSFHSKRYLPWGMLIHRQNSYTPCDKQRTGLREGLSREPANKFKNAMYIRPTHMVKFAQVKYAYQLIPL
jgi:hypothetical protein